MARAWAPAPHGLQDPCEVTLPAKLIRAGTNGVTLSAEESVPGESEPMPLTFRGARIRRLSSAS